MGRSTRLKACFIFFCFSFGIAAYSPFAKWVFTPNNLVNGKINDLSSNNNQPFALNGELIATSAVTCKGLHTASSDTYYSGTASAIPSSAEELGVSIWMSLQDNGRPVYVSIRGPDMSLYGVEFKYHTTLMFFAPSDSIKEVPISEGMF